MVSMVDVAGARGATAAAFFLGAGGNRSPGSNAISWWSCVSVVAGQVGGASLEGRNSRVDALSAEGTGGVSRDPIF